MGMAPTILLAALFAANCDPTETTAVTFLADAPPYSAEQGPCGLTILDADDLPIYELQKPLRTFEVIPLPDGAQALLIGAAKGPEETEYTVLAWSRGAVRALTPPDLAAHLAADESFSRGAVIEPVSGALLVDAPVFAKGDPGCCASRGRLLAMLGLDPNRGRLVLLGSRREQ